QTPSARCVLLLARNRTESRLALSLDSVLRINGICLKSYSPKVVFLLLTFVRKHHLLDPRILGHLRDLSVASLHRASWQRHKGRHNAWLETISAMDLWATTNTPPSAIPPVSGKNVILKLTLCCGARVKGKVGPEKLKPVPVTLSWK